LGAAAYYGGDGLPHFTEALPAFVGLNLPPTATPFSSDPPWPWGSPDAGARLWSGNFISAYTPSRPGDWDYDISRINRGPAVPGSVDSPYWATAETLGLPPLYQPIDAATWNEGKTNLPWSGAGADGKGVPFFTGTVRNLVWGAGLTITL
jgi:hypothetical protein